MSKAKTLSEEEINEVTDDSILSSQQQINIFESSDSWLSGENLSPRDTKKKSDVDKKDGLHKEVSLSESQTRRVVNKQSQSNSNTFEEIQIDTLNQEQKPNAFVLNKALDRTIIGKEKINSDAKLTINRNIGNANDWKLKWTSGIKHQAWVPSGLLDKPTAGYKVNDIQKNLQTASRSNKLSFDNGAQGSGGSRQTVDKDSQKQTVSTTFKRIENKTTSRKKNLVAERNSISSASANIGQGGNRQGRTFERRNTGSIQRVSNLGTRLQGSTNSSNRTSFSPKHSSFTSRNTHHRLPQTSMRSRNAVKFPGQFINANKVRNGANIGRQQRRRNNVRVHLLSSWNLQELLDFIRRFASKNTTNNLSNQIRSVVSELNRRSSNNRRNNWMKRSNLRSLSSRNYRQQSMGLKRLTPGTVFTGGPLYHKIILRQRTPPYLLKERYVPVPRT
ncbi:putative uncharacterized protein DDB_G0286901 [Mytilus californianus]|uniref:putative uncharacterized protein DDB_G0286901 n=1 Tax=Mytilus californianus TaxID=6549 RepID=UPI002245EC88|nr:putative uncharacterized protein DDB_G0286901 [Mytilus californianus]